MLPLQQRIARESVALALNLPWKRGFKGVEKANPREPFDYDYVVRPTFGFVVGKKNRTDLFAIGYQAVITSIWGLSYNPRLA
jgi:hypothetical protein